jgi:TatD DNase family protein
VLVDTHCHIDLAHFDDDREAVLERAQAAGIWRILVPSIDLAGSRRVLTLAEKHPMLRAAVGIHPNSSGAFSPDDVAELRDLAQHEKVDAIGEIGIDLYWKSVPLEQQQRALRLQLELAAELDRPVVIHDREAHEEVMTELAGHPAGAGVVLHAFSGGRAMAEAALARGYYLGVAGPLTYRKSDELRGTLAHIPLQRVLLETDAPYLAPEPRRGRRNEPAFVRHVAERLAQVRQESLEVISSATGANAARLFRWEQVE